MSKEWGGVGKFYSCWKNTYRSSLGAAGSPTFLAALSLSPQEDREGRNPGDLAAAWMYNIVTQLRLNCSSLKKPVLRDKSWAEEK